MANPVVLVAGWLPEGALSRLTAEFQGLEFVDARDPAVFEPHSGRAAVIYGSPSVPSLASATSLRWLQLMYAGVPQDLCPLARSQGILLTNMAGLYGPSIAEHALGLMTMLARSFHVVVRNQEQRRWDREVAQTMSDLQGKTLALVGVGNIGQAVARLARAYGMRVLGWRRTERPTPYVDRMYPRGELHAMLAEADYVLVAAPLTPHTDGLLGSAEFRAMKRGAVYVNVSRGGVAQEAALLDALRTGHLAAAGLDVFAVEPLPPDHPLWMMPQVLISPHYAGEVVNASALPAERFARNLRRWVANQELEGVVNLDWGY